MEQTLLYILSVLLGVFILVAITAFGKWHEYSKAQKLRDLVSWSVVQEKPYELLVHAHDLPLWSYISNAQIKFQFPLEYRIAGDDQWGFVKKILEEYQKDLTQSYFKGHLRIPKSKYEIPGEAYFMLTLYTFLSEHQCDYEFLGHDMRKERVSNSPGVVTYSLTDFAVVLHKTHYITYMYCRRSEILRGFVPEWNEKNLKEILDTGNIQMFRY